MSEKRFYGNKLITYRPYTSEDFERIPQVGKLTTQQRLEIAVIAHIFPFKTNNYVLNELITWNDPLQDPMFRFAFPQKKMLPLQEYNDMTHTLFRGAGAEEVQAVANDIRTRLGLKPAAGHSKDQVEISGIPVPFLHHRPDHTLAFTPAQSRNAYAWCAFCPGWTQYTTHNTTVSDPETETEALIHFLRLHPLLKTLVLTGGEPLAMRTPDLGTYLNAVLNNASGLKCIIIETRSLAQWPYRFILDTDASDMMDLFRNIVRSGIRLVVLENFSLPVELSTKAVALAIQQLKTAGVDVFTQTPLLPGINDNPQTLAALWKKQAALGCMPQDLVLLPFNGLPAYHLPLVKAFEIYRQGLQNADTSLTANGPTNGLVAWSPAGKVEIVAVDPAVITLRFVQGRNPDWNGQHFTAAYDGNAVSVTQLKPASGKKFFFEEELNTIYGSKFTEEY